MTEYFGWEEGFFKPGEVREPDEPRGYAILALKRELIHLGSSRNINTAHATYGSNMGAAVREFQSAVGLTPDAQIGPRTAKAMFHLRAHEVEADLGIPNHYLGKLLDLESSWYPASRNSDGDTGLAQIHLSAHPNVSEEEAYDPAFAVPWAGERLDAAHTELAQQFPRQSWTRRWWAAIFAHNAPAVADDWLEAGCPASGGPNLTVGGKVWDAYEWATLYVTVVLNRTC